MLNQIKDPSGRQLKEPTERFVIELADGAMIEAGDYREAAAVLCGAEYLDCETAETEWHLRLEIAKKIGLFIMGIEDKDNIIVYDERIGKIPYSYTDPNPDYDIPADPELIRVESEETFILSLAKIRYINLWEKTENDYQNIKVIKDIDREMEQLLVPFRQHIRSIPLHKRLGQ